MEHLEGPGPAAGQRLRGRAGLGGLGHREPGGAEIEHRHVRLDDRAAMDRGHRHPEHAGVGPGRRGHVRRLRRRRARSRGHAIRMIRQAPRVRLPLRERRQVLDEEDRQGVARAEERGAPAQLLALERAAPAVADLAHVHAAAPHRGHVGGQVVALQRHDPEAAALVQVLGEARVRAAGHDRAPIADAQDLEIVLVVERDRVVGGPAGMRAAGVDGEPETRVGLDPLGQVRHADHHVVDAGQHAGVPSRPCTAGSRGCTRAASGTPPACRSRTARCPGRCG